MVRRIPMLFMVGDFATEDFVAKRNKWSLLIESFWIQSDAHAQPRSRRPAMVAGPLLLPILAALLRSVEGFSSKWWPSSAHCVTSTSWTERVAARINELTRYLFGRHVRQCAEMESSTGQARIVGCSVARRIDIPSQPATWRESEKFGGLIH